MIGSPSRKTAIAAWLLLGALTACDSSDGAVAERQADPVSARTDAGRKTSDASVSAALMDASDVRIKEERTRQIDHPDPDMIGWIALDWLDRSAPLDEWARRDVESGRFGPGRINEFNRDEYTAQARTALEDQKKAGMGVGRLRLSVNARLSDYDPTYEEFYLGALSPGSHLTYRPFGAYFPNTLSAGVRVEFANAREASVLSVTPAEAEAMIERLDNFRNVTLDLDLSILDVTPASQSAVIRTRIDRYTIVSKGRPGPGGVSERIVRTVSLGGGED
ncbi:hypothetical protein [Parvularcula lutaonensis]|uniref:Uncharacterized protein n=1 Tax=Parvularcula lutaonensis TaxID=491923 RepID=A0ABV7MAA6_9PROT|nr:hypothetical protein [Parvularcula lutaonensis]GGY37081.1 hypothetical protein GCM10007148_01590 [Parvularcula lutaonensis]